MQLTKNQKYICKVIVFIIIVIIVLFFSYNVIINSITNSSTNSNTKIEKFSNSENVPKIAFLFLTYNNLKRPDIWNKFFGIDDNNINKSKYSNKYTIYNHAKESDKVTDILLKDRHIPEHIETCWGCDSLVEANTLMIREALKDPLNKKFILVSDSCIPIVSFDKFYNEVMKDDKSILGITYINTTIRRYNMLKNPSFPASKFVNHSGSGLIINKKHAEILNSELDNFKKDWISNDCMDEHYYGTILTILDSEFDNNNNNRKITFDIWQSKHINIDNICKDNRDDSICEDPKLFPNSPNTLKYFSNNGIDELRNNNFLCIRKVDSNTKVDINYLLS
jgi:hypothetical protein